MCDSADILSGLLPEEFLSRMRQLLTEEEYMAFLSCYGQKRFYSLRLNPLKVDRNEAEKLLGKAVAALAETKGEASEQERDSLLQYRDLQPVPWEPDGLYYPEGFRPGRLPWHEAGMYYIQEASAMAPAVLCDVQPGERVLDLCAAPGGKSTKLAASLQGRGILVANEIHPERARVLSSNLERMGVRNALVTNESPQRLASRFPRFFDRIVVDAPCSGEGMFRKEEEALSNWSPDNVRMCAQRQSDILEEAASMLRPGGRLVYSTCTFSPEENEGVIFRFLMEHPDFFLVSIPNLPAVRAEEWGFACGRPEWLPSVGIEPDRYGEKGLEAAGQLRGTLRLWPHLLKGEGHFAAVLRKDDLKSLAADGQAGTAASVDSRDSRAQAGNTGKEERRKKKEKGRSKIQRGGKRNSGDLSLNEAQHMWEVFCKENLIPSDAPDAVTNIGGERLCLFGSALFGLPAPAAGMSLEGLRVLRAGLHLGTVNRGRFEPSHALAMALARNEVCRYVEFEGDSLQAYAWIRGESVSAGTESVRGWTLILIDGCSIGWGKANGGIIKNHYPKGLRKGSGYTSNKINIQK